MYLLLFSHLPFAHKLAKIPVLKLRRSQEVASMINICTVYEIICCQKQYCKWKNESFHRRAYIKSYCSQQENSHVFEYLILLFV